MKNKRTTFFHSVIALLLCVSMLVGTTFAWFTDTVYSGINTIAAGNLDVEIYHTNAAVKNEKVNSTTELFKDLNGKDILWEPGAVSYENLTVTNEGSLAFCYQLAIVTDNENFVVDGSNRYGLSQVLKVGVVEGGITAADRAGVLASVKEENWTTLGEFLRSGSLLNKGDATTWGIVIYWQPGENDNLWNLNNGKKLNEGEVLSIDLGIKLVATQEINESDSFGPDYDENAYLPITPGTWTVSGAVSVADGKVAEATNIGGTASRFTAQIPVGVKVEDGVVEMSLTVSTKTEDQADVQLSEGQVGLNLDVHMDGVAEDNTVPMIISLGKIAPAGLYDGNIVLYHVENGETIRMTQVATMDALDAHNEFYYDAATGDVTLAMATFSTVYAAIAFENPWSGKYSEADISWYTDDPDAASFTLTTANELAGFAQIVGGMAKDAAGNVIEDDFDEQTVKLGADINLGGYIWYPIGYYNSEGTYEKSENAITSGVKPFKGTFEGNGHTIANFRQNTWEMKGDHNWYAPEKQYYRDAMGLFGLIEGGNVSNLVIDGMTAEGEITDIGCVTAYARGTCTFDNIRIANASCYSYNCRTAGIVGYDWTDGGSTYTFSNIEIDPTCTFGALWGSWDVACAGIMGFMSEASTASFEKCEVGCVLDVFNDVCANYQYYQYRYSGMMIGTVGKDSEPAKDIIKFTDCTVYYGDWANYYYCEFEKNSMASYSEDFQFSRVDKSEIVFDADGNVTGCTHEHTNEEDKQAVYLPFKQLYTGYGWGAVVVVEGVNVNEALYTITYINDGKVLDVTYVTTDNGNPYPTENEDAQKLAMQWAEANIEKEVTFGGWMTAASAILDNVPANNKDNVVLYPSFDGVYTATFVNQAGEILAWETFTKGAEALLKIPDEPELDGFEFDHWEIRSYNADGTFTSDGELNATNLASVEYDITLYPYYKYNGDVNLIPVDSDADGETNYYQVGGYGAETGEQELVEIPATVNGIPVTTINADAFSSYDDLHSVLIPGTIEAINSQSFSAYDDRYRRDTVTLYYAGDPAVWATAMEQYNADNYSGILKEKWDNAMGESSCVFFLDENRKVDLSKGYWELAEVKDPDSFLELGTMFVWQYHNHEYGSNSGCSNEHNNETVYTDNCACGCGIRPDAEYWTVN